jgi:hypothetical protein
MYVLLEMQVLGRQVLSCLLPEMRLPEMQPPGRHVLLLYLLLESVKLTQKFCRWRDRLEL